MTKAEAEAETKNKSSPTLIEQLLNCNLALKKSYALAVIKRVKRKCTWCILWLLFVPMALFGCTHTKLKSETLSLATLKLASTNNKPIVIDVYSGFSDDTTGHQYLLGVVPFGSVSVAHPDDFIRRAVYRELSLRGFKPLLGDTETLVKSYSAPLLTVKVKKLQTSAYDMIVTRRVFCEVSLEGRLLMPESGLLHSAIGIGSDGTFKRFGFEPELSQGLAGALSSALEDLFNNLGLGKAS